MWLVAGLASDGVLGGRLIVCSLVMCGLGALGFGGWSVVVARGNAAGAQNPTANAIAMVVCGFLVAGPDGILGGAVSRSLCDYNKCPRGEQWNPAVAGFVNGIASFGVGIYVSALAATVISVFSPKQLLLFCSSHLSLQVILLSAFTSQLVTKLGWSGLFGLFAAMQAASAVLALPAALLEMKHFKEKREKKGR